MADENREAILSSDEYSEGSGSWRDAPSTVRPAVAEAGGGKRRPGRVMEDAEEAAARVAASEPRVVLGAARRRWKGRSACAETAPSILK